MHLYKLFTSTLTSIFSAYGEIHQISHDSQEEFRAERCMWRQLQTIILALEDAKFTFQGIYILYIDFKNALGSIDHIGPLPIMKDLGYPQDIEALVRNIYSQSTTTCTWELFGRTQPIPIQRGTIQGDTLSPYLFIIFLEPLLRWLKNWNIGYSLKASNTKLTSATYANDLAILANKIASLQLQLNKLDKFCEWVAMDLGILKCAITGCPNKSKLIHKPSNTYINFRNQPIPISTNINHISTLESI
jgi:hypothetical protein